ncbi:MAG TPA: hypothetical protein VF277_00550 [Steroidobacteraceae bacterium]
MSTNDTNVSTPRSVENASNGAHRVIDRAAEAAHPAVDRLASNAHRAVDKAATGANRAAESLDGTGTRLREAGTHLTAGFRDFVRDRPVASLGIAVGLGFVLSSMLRRR